MEKIYAQQGDVILVEVKEIPAAAKAIKLSGNFIVERGEGVHTHVIEEKHLGKLDAYELNGVMYLRVKEDVPMVHEEHGTTKVFLRKIYKRMEREFDYESMEARQTQD